MSELLAEAGLGGAPDRARDVTVTSLTADSRAVADGSCFVATRGQSVDGHAFVRSAVERGAVAVVVERETGVPEGVVQVRVEDSRSALAALAAAFYGLRREQGRSGEPPVRAHRAATPPLRLVGITGTNGKTTVAWLLRSILTEASHPTALLGTIEYDLVTKRTRAPLTTPGAVDLCRHLATARDAGAAYGVLEVSSHALDQRRCDGLSFSVAVFTNLSGDHLDYHHSMDAYAAAKHHLFDLRAPEGVAVVNVDDDYGRALAADLPGEVLTFGLDARGADLTASVLSLDRQGSRFTLRGPSIDIPVHLSLLGRHNVVNALAATDAALALGVNPESIGRGLERVRGVPGRLERAEPDGHPFTVLVDYAHTDGALENALQSVRPLTSNRLICVFGCGGDRDRTKRPRMAAAAGRTADVAYVTSDNPRTEDPERIIDEILPGFAGSTGCRVEVEVDRRKAIHAAIDEARPGDTVLIAGKGHEDYQLVGDQVLDFDDVTVARSFLQVGALAEGVA
ncbi:MAG: UDP-N-acetylmuramoyl-L-alanyl-D-glutamate--2,6-diaminopimelate ligase [Phycisphaerae bacterium]